MGAVEQTDERGVFDRDALGEASRYVYHQPGGRVPQSLRRAVTVCPRVVADEHRTTGRDLSPATVKLTVGASPARH
jgi:hypothetical protein